MTIAATEGGTLEVLRNRRFLALWVAQLVTQVGGNMVLFGLTVQVFTLTGTSTSVSLLILSFLVPAVIFGAIAGVYVDRLDRRLILVTTNAIRAVLFLLLVLVQNDIGLILLLTALISTLTTFFGPAEIAMIPVVVPRRQLLTANSLHILTLQASFFLGFALLGPLVTNILGSTALLVLVAISYLVGAALCLLLPTYHPRAHVTTRASEAVGGAARAVGEAGSAVRATFDQLADGLRYIRDNKTVFWPLTYLAVTSSLVGVLGVLGPGFATEVLGLSERDFVVVVLPLGVGLVMGIFVLNLYGKHFTRRQGIEGGPHRPGHLTDRSVNRSAADDSARATDLVAVDRDHRGVRGGHRVRIRGRAGADTACRRSCPRTSAAAYSACLTCWSASQASCRSSSLAPSRTRSDRRRSSSGRRSWSC